MNYYLDLLKLKYEYIYIVYYEVFVITLNKITLLINYTFYICLLV
uniref:Uncharacterized protein n=1 Tax=viral metagenome TaxID=1070528 RepID=A0A6C0H8U1_9ZZZZ